MQAIIQCGGDSEQQTDDQIDWRQERYFKWTDSSTTITQDKKQAVDWFMEGANELTFYEWLNEVQQ
jgi:hypothetical protein